MQEGVPFLIDEFSTTPEQAKYIDKHFADCDNPRNPMNKEEFEKIREHLTAVKFRGQKWTQANLAEYLTKAKGTVTQYSGGGLEIPEKVAVKMRELYALATAPPVLPIRDELESITWLVTNPEAVDRINKVIERLNAISNTL